MFLLHNGLNLSDAPARSLVVLGSANRRGPLMAMRLSLRSRDSRVGS